MRYFLTIVAAFTAVVSGGKSFACPYLIRPNNKWEIGEVMIEERESRKSI